LALLGVPLLGFLKKRGDVNGVELVEELLVNGGHPDGNIVGRLLFAEGESELGSDKVPKIGTNLSHQLSVLTSSLGGRDLLDQSHED